ncbi:kinase-like domain-containing protein [Emericellopsis atlantica]|uniref:Kinase-like domain-containing protein n=1 Tax=Emericellopsis atlantica TaxID=2614577 RepID=A0A9P8CLB6_9HYPO|nr:kinase-like domain-containing protein [Emericellopsis atlantica]KAG9250830.1 kinase-like domain-containing protein [Emericellopsis atlantica]
MAFEPEDVIAYLFPHKGEGFPDAASAVGYKKNKRRFKAAERTPDSARDSQERSGGEDSIDENLIENLDGLVLLFSHGAKTGAGIVLGHSDSSDVVLRERKGVSRSHVALTFNDQNMLVARDMGSSGGTRVVYKDEKLPRVKGSEWLIQGPSIVKDQLPVLDIADKMQFKVVLPQHDVESADYIQRVARFRLGTAGPESIMGNFGISSGSSTQLPTGQQSPSAVETMFFEQVVGRGGFGTVTYAWNEHIVAFRNATFFPEPRLEIEYVPGGSLDQHNCLSTIERTQILCQLTSALEYLHNRPVRITHRDIKPQNILDSERGERGIVVKFADFGLSKESEFLQTICGMPEWLAREVLSLRRPYDESVDIWSLGLVLAWLECGLPNYELGMRRDSRAWAKEVRRHIQSHCYQTGSVLLSWVLDNMVVEDPGMRLSARECHVEAWQLMKSAEEPRYR